MLLLRLILLWLCYCVIDVIVIVIIVTCVAAVVVVVIVVIAAAADDACVSVVGMTHGFDVVIRRHSRDVAAEIEHANISCAVKQS